jgi:hypothetical protein
MLKQSSSRMKRVMSIFLAVPFVISVTAVVASADHDHDHWWHHDHKDLDQGHWWHHEDLDRDHL